MRIDRCICTGKTFDQLYVDAQARGQDLEAIGRSCGAGARCGLCRPYLKKTLATGQTVFNHIVIDPALKKPCTQAASSDQKRTG